MLMTNPLPLRPPPIRTDASNAFAKDTMRRRLPEIISEVIALNPDYPPSIQRSLTRLRSGMAADERLPTLPAHAPDALDWSQAREAQSRPPLTWQQSEWFFAETFAYRCIIDAVRWLETERDPFLPKKQQELSSAGLWTLLARALVAQPDAESALLQALEFALWGNRIDLSYAASLAHGTAIRRDDLLVDERATLLEHLAIGAPRSGSVVIIADNTGSELAMDLVLADCLLQHVCERVLFCLKWHPTFVSDATVADVWMMLAAMGRHSPGLAQRLQGAWAAGRLSLLPHPYWNSSLFLWDLPASLRQLLWAARLVIIKGDANYRRALGDCIWPPQSPFAHALQYMQPPTLCLRTLKSDPIVGLPDADTAQQLDTLDPHWRVNGRRGIIQFKP